jgi:hypothetical protein
MCFGLPILKFGSTDFPWSNPPLLNSMCVTRTKLRFGLLNHYLYNTTHTESPPILVYHLSE